jgi:hypothetical protein
MFYVYFNDAYTVVFYNQIINKITVNTTVCTAWQYSVNSVRHVLSKNSHLQAS